MKNNFVKSIKKISIPKEVESIGSHAFCDYKILTQIIILSIVTSIENSAFCRCSSLKNIEIPSSVIFIKEYAVVHILFDKSMIGKFNLNDEKVGNVISMMTGIKGCIIQLAFIELEDGLIRVRLRSRYVPIRGVAEKFGGDGHEFASGAQLHEKTEIEKVIEEADKILSEFKSKNTDLI